jgi:hypothetical protein
MTQEAVLIDFTPLKEISCIVKKKMEFLLILIVLNIHHQLHNAIFACMMPEKKI